MLAKLVDATTDPDRMDLAISAVREELIPGFLAHEGALHGYWSTDAKSGHLLAITMWRDVDSLLEAAAADGAARATVGDRIGWRLHSVHTLPVLASTDLSAGHTDPGRIRVTWMEGIAPAIRGRMPQLHGSTVADRSAIAGFCGSYWLGDERSIEGCEVSLWGRSANGAAGVAASRRQRRRLARTTGVRIRSVHDHQTFGVARTSPDPAGRTLEVARV